MISIPPNINLDENEIQFDFIRAAGPGGQNVNKVASAVQLRFDIAHSPSLSAELKKRLIKLAGQRVTTDGILIIEAKRFRTQEQNRQDALDRFVALIQQAARPPKKRRPTQPSLAAREARLKSKHHRSQIKSLRRQKEEPYF